MSCALNENALPILGSIVTKLLKNAIATEEARSKSIIIPDIAKTIYNHLKNTGKSEQVALDAARAVPFLVRQITVFDGAFEKQLLATTPKLRYQILEYIEKFEKDDSNLSTLKKTLGIEVVDASSLEETNKKSKKITGQQKEAKRLKTSRPLAGIYNSILTYAQEYENYTDPTKDNFLVIKPEYRRNEYAKRFIDRLFKEQVRVKGIEDSSELKLPGAKEPGVYLRMMTDKEAFKKFPSAFADVNTNFFKGNELIAILVDSQGEAIMFNKEGSIDPNGEAAYYRVESDAIRDFNNKIITTKADFDNYINEYKQTNDYRELNPVQRSNRIYIYGQMFKRFQQRLSEIIDSRKSEEVSIDKITEAAEKELIDFYNNLANIRTYLKKEPNAYVDNVIKSSPKGFVVNQMYNPTPLSKVKLGKNLNISVITRKQTEASSLIQAGAYISYPDIEEPILIFRTPLVEKPEIINDIVSFFTDILYVKEGNAVKEMSIAKRSEYVSQFVSDLVTDIKFAGGKDKETGEIKFENYSPEGEVSYRVVVGPESFRIKYDNTDEDIAERARLAEAIKNKLSTAFVEYGPDNKSRDTSLNAKNVKKAISEGATVVQGTRAAKPEDKGATIAEQVKGLAPRTIFAYPTGSKTPGLENEHFIVNYPFMGINNKLLNKNYQSVEKKETYKDGQLVEFSSKKPYNEFVRSNFSIIAETNPEGEIVQVNPSFVFTPNIQELEKVDTAVAKYKEEDYEKKKQKKAKQKSQTKAKPAKEAPVAPAPPAPTPTSDPVTQNNGENVSEDDILDRLGKDPDFFNKSEEMRAMEVKANTVHMLEALIWYEGKTRMKKALESNPSYKSMFESLDVEGRNAVLQTLEAAEADQNKLAKIFPFKVLFKAVNQTDYRPSATWSRDGIVLYSYYNKSPKEAALINYTDIYHEAWHGFTQSFLSEDERKELYEEASKKEGSFVDFKGNLVTFKSATFKQLDEYLAEDFRHYMMLGGKQTDKKTPVKNSLFRKLLNFLTELFLGADVNAIYSNPLSYPKIHDIYEKIRIGNIPTYDFYKQNVNQTVGVLENSMLARDPNSTLKVLGYEDAQTLVASIDSMISDYANKLNAKYGVYSFTSQIMKKSSNAADIYKLILNKFKNEILPSIERRLDGDVATFIEQALKTEKISYTDEQLQAVEDKVTLKDGKRTISIKDIESILNIPKSQRQSVIAAIKSELSKIDNAYETYQLEQARVLALYAIDNFGDVNNIKANKDGKGLIAYHQKKSKYLSNEDKDLSFDDIDDNNSYQNSADNSYSDKSNEISAYDRASEAVHYLLRSIHKYDENNKAILNKLGIQELYDEKTVWNRLNRILQGSTTPTEMYEKMLAVEEQGFFADPIIKEVREKLGPPSETMTTDAFNLWVQFGHVMSMVNIPLWQVNIEESVYGRGESAVKNYDVKVGSSNSVYRKVRQMWNNKFKATDTDYIKKNKEREPEELFDLRYLDVNAILKDFGSSKIITIDTTLNKIKKISPEVYDKLEKAYNTYNTKNKEVTFEKYLEFNETARDIIRTYNKNNVLLKSGVAFDFFRSIGVVLSNKPIIKNAVNDPINPVGNAANIFDKMVQMRERGIDKVFSLEDVFNETPSVNKFKTLPSENTNYINLAILETKNADYTSNYIVTNAAGNKQYEMSQHSTLSMLLTEINKVNSLKELVEKPHLSHFDPNINPDIANSVIFNALFDVEDYLNDGIGEKRIIDNAPNKLNIGNVAGITFIDAKGKSEGIEASKADEFAKHVLDLHSSSFLNRVENTRAADKGSSFSMWVSRTLTNAEDDRFYIDQTKFIKDGAGNVPGYLEAADIMLGYLNSELKRINILEDLKERIKGGEQIEYDANFIKRASEFIVFSDILPKDLLKQIKKYKSISEASIGLKKPNLEATVKEEITKYLDWYYNQVFNKNEKTDFISKSLMSEVTAKAISKKISATPSKVKNAILRSYAINNWIHNYEISVLAFGGVAQFTGPDDYTKRIAGAQSAGTIPITDPVFIKRVNADAGLYGLSLNDPEIEKNTISEEGIINTAVLEDSKVPTNPEVMKEILDAIRENETKKFEKQIASASPAQLKKINAVIDAKVKNVEKAYGELKEGDGQGWISFDFYRSISRLLGSWTKEQEAIYKKIVDNTYDNSEDLFEFFPVLKLQYWGPVMTDYIPLSGFHKFSLVPLVPPLIKGKQIEGLARKMMRENIDYSVFFSGSKLGNVTKISQDLSSVKDKFYKRGREINDTTGEANNFTKNKVFLHYLKKQLEIAPEYKGLVSFPTQMRKLIERGMFLNGVPIDWKPELKGNQRLEKWNEASDADKKTSDYYNKTLNYEHYIRSITDIRTAKLKKELGIDGNNLKIKNGKVLMTDKLREFLVNALEQQDLADHEIRFIRNAEGTLAKDLSLSLSAEKLEKVLNSIVVKRLVRQKFKGEGLIQVSTAGFENKLRFKLTDEEIAKYNPTNDLAYYRRKKGPNGTTSAAKCKITLQEDFFALLDLMHLDGKVIGDIDRLNEMVRKDEWLNIGDHRKMVTIIGPRIPTQENNSMEFMEVFEFLPPGSGNIIILPSEIVAKSGGDFDVDKLTMLFPYLKTKYNYDFWKVGDGFRKLKELNIDYSTAIEILNTPKKELTEDQKKIYDVIKKNTPKEVVYTTDNKTEEGLSNNLLNSMKELLELDINYISLVTPNDTSVAEPLAKGLAEYVSEYNPKNRFHNVNLSQEEIDNASSTRIFEIPFNSYKHGANNIGKVILGIIAVANNYSAIFNRIGAHMNHSYTVGKQTRKIELHMPHNIVNDAEGNEVISLSGLYDAFGEHSIANIIGQLINGSVDVAKDAWIFFLNAYEEVIPSLLYMIQAGVPLDVAVYTISHPLVREYVTERKRMTSAVAKAIGAVDPKSKLTEKTQAKIKVLQKALGAFDPEFYGPDLVKNLTISKNSSSARYGFTEKLFEKNKKVRKFFFDAPNLFRAKLRQRVTDKNYETQVEDAALFLHFLQIEEQAEAVTNLMQKTNFDTKPSMSLFDAAMKKYELDEVRNNPFYPSNLVSKIEEDSPIGSFHVQDFQSNVWSPVLSLRSNPDLTKFLIGKVSSKGFKKFLKRLGWERSDFTNQFINDIPSFVFQNFFNKKDLPTLKNYKGLEVKDITSKQIAAKAKFDAFVKTEAGTSTMYINRDQIQQDYIFLKTERTLDKELTFEDGQTIALAPVNAALFPNFDSYSSFVLERETLRSLYPGQAGFEKLMQRNDVKKLYKEYSQEMLREEGETDESFENRLNLFVKEVTLRNMALENTFNMFYLFRSHESMADRYDQIRNDYPELLGNYSVLKNLDINIKENLSEAKRLANIVLSDIDIDNGDTLNIYNQNLRELSNPGQIKINTDNVVEKERVADFFAKLPFYALLQSGMSTQGMFALGRMMPQEQLTTVLEPLINQFVKNINPLSLERYFQKAEKVYKNNDLRIRYKQFALPKLNMASDLNLTEQFVLDQLDTETISQAVAVTDYEEQELEFKDAPRDENGNPLYSGDKIEALQDLEELIGNVALFPKEIVLEGEEVKEVKKITSKAPISTEVKPGVAELFESNPELVNSVYEVLGYSYTGEYSPAALYESGIKTPDEKDYLTYSVVENKSGKKYINTLNKGKKSTDKGIGKNAYYKFIIENKGKNITTDTELSVAGKKVLEQLEKEGYVTKTDAKVVQTKESGAGYSIDVYDKPLYEFTGKMPESYLTPQQKQQAQKLYSQYLDTIFPDSQVKDVVYHGSDSKKEKFSSIGAGTHFGTLKAAKERRNKAIIPVILNINNPVLFKDILADDVLKAADEFLKENGEYLEYGYRNEESGLLVYLYNQGKIDSNTLWDALYSDRNTMMQILQNALGSNGYRYINEVEDKGSTSYVVFEPEQIHILGSKQDIEGFKKHVEEAVTVEQDPALGAPEESVDDSKPYTYIVPKAAATETEKLKANIDSLVNSYVDSSDMGAVVAFPDTGVGQSLLQLDPATNEVSPTISPIARETFLYLSEKLAKTFGYNNKNLDKLVGTQTTTKTPELIEITDDDVRDSIKFC